MLKSVEVRRVGPYEYDVFFGNQWGTWSRVHQGRSACYVKAGEALPKPVLRELHAVFARDMPITYGQTLGEMLFAFHALQTRHSGLHFSLEPYDALQYYAPNAKRIPRGNV